MEPSSDLSIKQNAPSDEPLEFSDEIPEILEQDVVSPTAIRREPPANEPLLLTKPETLETTAEKTFGDTNTSGEEIALRNASESTESRNQSPTAEIEVQAGRVQTEPLFKTNFDDWTPFEESPFEYETLELQNGPTVDANGFLILTPTETNEVPKLKPPSSQYLTRNSLRQKRRYVVGSPEPKQREPAQPESPDSVLNHPNSRVQRTRPADPSTSFSIHIPRATVTRVAI